MLASISERKPELFWVCLCISVRGCNLICSPQPCWLVLGLSRWDFMRAVKGELLPCRPQIGVERRAVTSRNGQLQTGAGECEHRAGAQVALISQVRLKLAAPRAGRLWSPSQGGVGLGEGGGGEIQLLSSGLQTVLHGLENPNCSITRNNLHLWRVPRSLHPDSSRLVRAEGSGFRDVPPAFHQALAIMKTSNANPPEVIKDNCSPATSRGRPADRGMLCFSKNTAHLCSLLPIFPFNYM